MASSKRYTTTKEERIQAVLDKGNPRQGYSSKLCQYLAQPNVKKYNSVVIDNGFKKSGRKSFNSYEECYSEVVEYFQLAIDNDIIPTIASLSLYLGLTRDTMYALANDTFDYSDILKSAINSCHAIQETGALEGTVASVPWIFTAKNYFNLHDTSPTVVLQPTVINTNNETLKAIQEQIALENSNND